MFTLLFLYFVSIILVVYFFYVTWLVYRKVLIKYSNRSYRGLLRRCYNLEIEFQDVPIIKKWVFALLFSMGILPLCWLIYYTVATDYSFFIGCYVLFWLYSLIRYPLWEKSDFN